MELVLQQLQADLRAFKRLKEARQLPHQEEQGKEQKLDRVIWPQPSACYNSDIRVTTRPCRTSPS